MGDLTLPNFRDVLYSNWQLKGVIGRSIIDFSGFDTQSNGSSICNSKFMTEPLFEPFSDFNSFIVLALVNFLESKELSLSMTA